MRNFLHRILIGFNQPLLILPLLLSFHFAQTATAQDYKNSVASTDFDYIHESDPSAFKSIEYVGMLNAEMPDKRPGNKKLRQPAFVFKAAFSDGCSLQLSIDSAFKDKDAAETEARRYVHPLGKLPTALRLGVNRVVIHQGGRDTTAFSDQGLIVLYSDNATKRISNHDLEETVFHESVHAAWDKKHAGSKAWKKAQAQDGRFVTAYAKRKPAGEDLAESALFAYALIHHPGRIPAADAKKIKNDIPARIRFVAGLVPPGKPIFYPIKKAKTAEQGNEKNAGKSVAPAVKKRPETCVVDLTSPGQLSDILSNALMLGLDKDEKVVQDFLEVAQEKASSGEELFQMTLTKFKLEEADLKSELIEYLHCNCEHKGDAKSNASAKQIVEGWKPAIEKTK